MKKLILWGVILCNAITIARPLTVVFSPSPDDAILTGYSLHWGTNQNPPYPFISNVGKSCSNKIDNVNFQLNVPYYLTATSYKIENGLTNRSSYAIGLVFIMTNYTSENVIVIPSNVKNVRILEIKP